MSRSNLTKLITEATERLSIHGIVVRRDRSLRSGGCCTLDGTRYVVIGTQLPPETVLEVLLDALRAYHCPLDGCSAALRKRYYDGTAAAHPPESNGQQSQLPHRALPKRAPRSEA
jgi:hypothetical protein